MGKAKVAPPQAPVCEECDIEMHPFAFGGTEGWACAGCGWSVDNEWPAQPQEGANATSRAEAKQSEKYRVGAGLFELKGSFLHDMDAGSKLLFSKATNPVAYRDATAAEFLAAVSRVLNKKDYLAVQASRMNIPEQCVFVAKQVFLEDFNPKAKPEDLALIRQVFWRLSQYDGTTGLS